MNSFTEIFERFSPSAWLYRGITTRDTEINRSSVGSRAMQASRGGFVVAGAAFAIAAAFADPAAAQSSVSAELRGTVNVPGVISRVPGAEVPRNYWPKMVNKIGEMHSLNESDYVDVDSVF